MTREEYYPKLQEILDKFPGWETKYNTSPAFCQIIHMLIAGEDPYKIISQILIGLEELNTKFELYLKNSTPFIIHHYD
jgi:hypothetical protein